MKHTILAIIAIGLYSCSPKPDNAIPPPPPIIVASIQPSSINTYQQYPASIKGVDEVEIRPQISGTLAQVHVDEGAYVTAGTPLFKIDERPFKAALNNALAKLRAAESAAFNAELEVQKLTPLVQNKVISDYQLKAARAAAGVAKANIDEAKANISTAQINLGFTLIKAPVSGYIGRLEKKKGSLVGPADASALTDLSDVHNVHVYFSLSEDDFVNFKAQYPGETLTEKIRQLPPVSLLLSDNSTYPVKGYVDIIDGQFDKSTGAITFRANFPNPRGLLRSGNTGKIQLSLLHKDALLVPQSATLEIQDKIFVYQLADSNKIKKQAIVISGRSGHYYVVKEGIKVGDHIVVDEINNLQEGQVIDPQTTKKLTATNN
ncbi:efflux RND transporter periplasmic adaptor subunit [Dyadobacter beijingensis]|uniref:efflux RND transporter periplasmic adaptor subunit n=1 Tax=Dyadobacter beijingensis TaxID=365489 RepID=UPI00035D8BBB|nr:efflux RND transporter periplasmic adaptor subunit [Dyadobacter beijingensis]